MGRRPRHENFPLAPMQLNDTAVARNNEDLEHLAPDLLRRRWKSLMGKAPPSTLSLPLMAKILIWKEQMMRLEPLDDEVMAILQNALAAGTTAGSSAAVALPKRLKPGTVLSREHAGVTHRVMVLKDGYAWKDQTFKSLSEVARAITGTQWNGLVFFGLKKRKSRAKEESETTSKRQIRRSHTSYVCNSASVIPYSVSLPVKSSQETSFKDARLQGVCNQDKPQKEASLRSESSVP